MPNANNTWEQGRVKRGYLTDGLQNEPDYMPDLDQNENGNQSQL